MTDETPPRKLELSPAQVAGSALAAVSGAFFASWAGTTGTIIGAALGSVIATVGAATYTWSLRRTSAAVRRTTAVVRENGMHSTVVLPRLAERSARKETRQVEPDAEKGGRLSGLPWLKVAAVAAAVMVVALAAITGFEAVTGRPVAAYTGGSSQTGTTVGSLVGVDGTTRTKPTTRTTSTPTPTPTPSASSSATTTPTPTPSPSASSSATPTPTPTATPSSTSSPSPSSSPTP